MTKEQQAPETLAIIGSRSLEPRDWLVRDLIGRALDELRPTCVISGGAKGPDRVAAEVARERGLITLSARVGEPVWDAPAGYRTLNHLIAKVCDRLVSIEDADLKPDGVAWTRERARSLGKPVRLYRIDRKDRVIVVDLPATEGEKDDAA